MAKEDKEKKSTEKNSTERKAFWISHYMQINLDIHLSISSLRNLHWEFGLAKTCKFSHQITKQDTKKLKIKSLYPAFHSASRTKCLLSPHFPLLGMGLPNSAETCETCRQTEQWGPHEALAWRIGHMYERWDSKSHLYPIIINN